VSEVFLGVIAAAVLVMAVIQVAVVVIASRAASRLTALASQFEQDIRPLITNLQTITADAARATAVAAAQVDRADKLFAELSTRLEQTLATVQDAMLSAARGNAWLAGLKAVLAAFRDFRSPSRRPSNVEEEDALFIG
jgi:hypothetical protein